MSIYSKLYDWQQDIVNLCLDKQSYGLYLDMGIGKTPISLSLAEQHNCDKLLIISINSKAKETVNTEGSWFNWVKQSNINYQLISKRSSVQYPDEPEAMLVNYESLFSRGNVKTSAVSLKENILEFIKRCKGKKVALIIDESHKIKSLQSMQTKAIFKIQSQLKLISNELYTYLLTGTPFTSGYEDIYSQLKLLGCTMNKSEFVDKFCIRGNIAGLLGWQQPIVGYKNIDSLYNLIHRFAITMKSEDIEGVKLPEKLFKYYTTKMSKDFEMLIREKVKVDELNEYLSLRKLPLVEYQNKQINNVFYANIDYPNERWLAETSGSFWLRARQLSIGFQGNADEYVWYNTERLDALSKFLENNENNYVLFYNYTPELFAIYDICEKLRYNIDVYCGDIKSLYFYEKYANSSEEKKLENNKNIIISNFASGSTGMNWQEYNQCIIFSLPVYKDYAQGIKRIDRTGQKSKTVTYHIFSQNNWLDKSMQKALDEKIDYNDDMFKQNLKGEL